MNFIKGSIVVFLLSIFAVLTFSAISKSGVVYQVINLKNDGSGSIKLSYSAQNTVLQANKFVLGKFAFSDKLARQNFSSANTTVKNAKLDFNVKDSMYFITVELDFKDFNKLNQASGFSYLQTHWYGTDTGAVFEYIITPGSGSAKFFDALSYIVNFESDVKSANGTIKGKSVTWGSRTHKNTNFNKDVSFIATTSAKVDFKKQVSAPPTAGDNKSSGNESEKKKDEDKSCGLFGFELPFILSAGFVYTSFLRRRRVK